MRESERGGAAVLFEHFGRVDTKRELGLEEACEDLKCKPDVRYQG